MASPVQIAANQLNSRKSTGPRSPEGRAKMSGMGEIDENAPSEANFDETMSIVEAQESIQVTANSGALSGLDNGVAQPGEDSTPEQAQAPASAAETAIPKPETPDSSDRACRGSWPATVSKRGKRRLRREKEGRAAERGARGQARPLIRQRRLNGPPCRR